MLNGLRRRLWPLVVRADDSLHRAVGLTVSTYDRSYPVVLPLHPDNVEVLGDSSFVESCRAVRGLTLLDTARLANLWTLAGMCHDDGAIIEVGSYLGGGALHISNRHPTRRIFVCDSFGRSFEELDVELDSGFGEHMFNDGRRQDVEALFTSRNRDVQMLDGYFPDSASDVEIGPIAFAHVDVDVYSATKKSLNYIEKLMTPRSFIVLDDYRRSADGVNEAVDEFVAEQPGWIAIPLFPGQALLISDGWFD